MFCSPSRADTSTMLRVSQSSKLRTHRMSLSSTVVPYCRETSAGTRLLARAIAAQRLEAASTCLEPVERIPENILLRGQYNKKSKDVVEFETS